MKVSISDNVQSSNARVFKFGNRENKSTDLLASSLTSCNVNVTRLIVRVVRAGKSHVRDGLILSPKSMFRERCWRYRDLSKDESNPPRRVSLSPENSIFSFRVLCDIA
ncbi:hypothetical protein HanRHA438_Chr00c06g0846181 [Helianthus annuus]|nr:hypothetical protein HanRHA438_Chr00c06g0846181 [Helianthus annuus]